MQLKITMNTAMTAEEKAQQLEKALKKEEVKIVEIEKELQRLRDHQVTLYPLQLCILPDSILTMADGLKIKPT